MKEKRENKDFFLKKWFNDANMSDSERVSFGFEARVKVRSVKLKLTTLGCRLSPVLSLLFL